MKTIGLLGGMSWQSTSLYYRALNEQVAERLGGLHSAQLLLASVDFHRFEQLQREGNWDEAGALLTDLAVHLEKAGADMLLICTNTMHRVADQIQSSLRIPLLHIAEVTGDVIQDQGIHHVGLLGTRFTMEEEFFRARLQRRGIQCSIPGAQDRSVVDRVIYEELCLGEIRTSSRETYLRITEQLVKEGCDGIIAGCTEIGMLIGADDLLVPLFDTTRIHVRAAIDHAVQ